MGPSPAPQMTYFWRYEQAEVRDDVKLELDKSWKLTIWKVTSGHSGKQYYVQILQQKKSTIWLCNCPQGIFRAPLSITSVDFCACDHSAHLKEYLIDRGLLEK